MAHRIDRLFIVVVTLVDSQVVGREAAEDNILNLRRILQRGQDCIDCNAGGKLDWIAIDARADTRESQRNCTCRTGQLDGAPIARCQEFWLSIAASTPDRTHRVNDVLGLESVALGEFRVASLAASEQPAFVYQLWARGAMNGAINPTPTEQ